MKLLSKLNHENVVRYYCSWIESTTIDTSMQDSKQLFGSSFSESTEISDKLDSDGAAPVLYFLTYFIKFIIYNSILSIKRLLNILFRLKKLK